MKVIREVPLPSILKEKLDALELGARRMKEAIENAQEQIKLVEESLVKAHYKHPFAWNIPGKDNASFQWCTRDYGMGGFKLRLRYAHGNGGNSSHWDTVFSEIKDDELLLKYSVYLSDFVEAFIAHSDSLIQSKKLYKDK